MQEPTDQDYRVSAMQKVEKGPCCIIAGVLFFVVFTIAVGSVIIATHLYLLRKHFGPENNAFNTSSSEYSGDFSSKSGISKPIEIVKPPVYKHDIVIATLVCRSVNEHGPVEEAAILIKSVLISALLNQNVSSLTLHVFLQFHDDEQFLLNELGDYGFPNGNATAGLNLTTLFHSVSGSMPKSEKAPNVIIQCEYLRLFLAAVFPDLDSILYLDPDVIVTGNIADLWIYLDKMKHEQLIGAGMDIEPDNPNQEYQESPTDIPMPTNKGLNGGVMLMNLTKMREEKWVDKAFQVWIDYSTTRHIKAQQLINILLFYDPDLLRVLPCNFNFRPGACMSGLFCNASRTDPLGIQLVHQWYNPGYTVQKGMWNTFWDIAKGYNAINLTSPTLNLGRDLMIPIRGAYANRNATAANSLHGKCDGILNTLLFKKYFKF